MNKSLSDTSLAVENLNDVAFNFAEEFEEAETLPDPDTSPHHHDPFYSQPSQQTGGAMPSNETILTRLFGGINDPVTSKKSPQQREAWSTAAENNPNHGAATPLPAKHPAGDRRPGTPLINTQNPKVSILDCPDPFADVTASAAPTPKTKKFVLHSPFHKSVDRSLHEEHSNADLSMSEEPSLQGVNPLRLFERAMSKPNESLNMDTIHEQSSLVVDDFHQLQEQLISDIHSHICEEDDDSVGDGPGKIGLSILQEQFKSPGRASFMGDSPSPKSDRSVDSFHENQSVFGDAALVLDDLEDKENKDPAVAVPPAAVVSTPSTARKKSASPAVDIWATGDNDADEPQTSSSPTKGVPGLSIGGALPSPGTFFAQRSGKLGFLEGKGNTLERPFFHTPTIDRYGRVLNDFGATPSTGSRTNTPYKQRQVRQPLYESPSTKVMTPKLTLGPSSVTAASESAGKPQRPPLYPLSTFSLPPTGQAVHDPHPPSKDVKIEAETDQNIQLGFSASTSSISSLASSCRSDLQQIMDQMMIPNSKQRTGKGVLGQVHPLQTTGLSSKQQPKTMKRTVSRTNLGTLHETEVENDRPRPVAPEPPHRLQTTSAPKNLIILPGKREANGVSAGITTTSLDVTFQNISYRGHNKVQLTLRNLHSKPATYLITPVGRPYVVTAIFANNSRSKGNGTSDKENQAPRRRVVEDNVFRVMSDNASGTVASHEEITTTLSFNPVLPGKYTQDFHVRCNFKVITIHLEGTATTGKPQLTIPSGPTTTTTSSTNFAASTSQQVQQEQPQPQQQQRRTAAGAASKSRRLSGFMTNRVGSKRRLSRSFSSRLPAGTSKAVTGMQTKRFHGGGIKSLKAVSNGGTSGAGGSSSSSTSIKHNVMSVMHRGKAVVSHQSVRFGTQPVVIGSGSSNTGNKLSSRSLHYKTVDLRLCNAGLIPITVDVSVSGSAFTIPRKKLRIEAQS
ncbi:hypothetical protein HK102_012249, partial [Quaeritorhiza haematococci]